MLECGRRYWGVPLAVHSLKSVQARQRRCEYDSEAHIILASPSSERFGFSTSDFMHSFCIYI